jgi:hypothetical protein
MTATGRPVEELTNGAIIGSHPVGRSVSEGEHVSETLWVTAVIHGEVRHFHQMNHRCRAGVDWRHCGVVAKAIVGLWVWAQWW